MGSARWWRAGSSAHPLLGVLLTLLLTGFRCASAAATCYNPDGTQDTEGKLAPCDPSADVSPCCSHADYCLSNGLCLDAGGNNGFSIQGCTDKNWGAGCNLICPLSGVSYDGYIYIQQCSSLNGADNPMCCGEDYTCCSVSSEVKTTIPLWTTLFRAGGGDSSTAGSALSTTPTPSSSASSTASSDSTSRSSRPENSGAAETSPSSTPSQTGETSSGGGGGVDKSLAIGLGVGIPLGLALIGALTFLGMQIRKQNRGAKAQANNSMVQPQYYPSPGTGYDPMTSAYLAQQSQYPQQQQQQRQELPYEPPSEIGGNQIKELPSN